MRYASQWVGVSAFTLLAVGFDSAWGRTVPWPPSQTAGSPARSADGPGRAARQDAAQPPQAAPDSAAQDDEGRKQLASEEALARFQEILRRRPLHNPAFAGLVRHFAEQGKLAELVQQYAQRVASLPDEDSLKVVLARLHLRSGRAEDAARIVATIEGVPEILTRDASAWLVFKSEVFQRIGRDEDAAELLNEAMAQARSVSQRMKLTEALADLHLRRNRRDEATAVLKKLAETYPDSYLHRRRIADAMAQRELYEAAVTEYRAMLTLVQAETDRRCEVLRQLGRSLERLERRQEAIDVYGEAIGLLAADHWLQRELNERMVQLYRASDRLDDLVEYCRKQIARAPEQTSMRVLLAQVLASSGESEAAKAALAEAVQLFPKDRGLSEQRIALLERLDDVEAAAGEFERIIAHYPNELELYIGYGRFLAENEQLAAARNQWKHVLQNALADASLALRLAGLFEPYELYDDAVECYERAVALAPEQAEGYVGLSRLWFFRGEKDKALAVLERLGEANPSDAAVHAELCHAMLGMGLADEALTAIERACELNKQQVRYQKTRADLLVRAGRLEEALAVRRGVIDVIRNPVEQSQAIGVLVSMYGSAGKLAALKDAEAARVAESPKDAVALMLLARAADFERDFPTARKWLTRLLESQPVHEEARRQLARLYEAVGDVDAAVQAYRQLIDLHPTRARQYYQAIADARLRYQDRVGAIETLEQMASASPDNATVLKDVAEQLVRLAELERAIALYEQSLRVQPGRHEVRLAYAKALSEAGRLEEALAEFKTTALQRNDRDSAVAALSKLHETASQLGALDQVLEELYERVEADPSDTLVARTLAQLLVREFEYDRAMKLLDLVLRHHPRDGELQLARGQLLRRLTRFDEALEAYRVVLRFPNIDRDYVLGEMGKTCFEAGRVEAARQFWRQIGHKLYAGTLLRNNGLLQEAIDVFREAIRLRPDEFALHRNLIKALEAAGQTDDALAAARRLLDLEPDNVLNIQRLAKAYLTRGDRNNAKEIAGRLFSSDVTDKQPRSATTGMQSGMNIMAASWQMAWGGGGMGGGRSNLDRAVQFFQQNGLVAELEEILTEQLEVQPRNAILRETAINLFSEQFNKPERALALLKEIETAEFPLEYQLWLGQSSQRDYMRSRQYQLIATKPVLRDARLTVLEAKPTEALDRDEILEFAVIRQAQGASEKSIELLSRAVDADGDDAVARSALTDALMAAEKFEEAEPHALAITRQLAEQRERLREEMAERVRRDFVRTLPVQFQLRVTDELLRQIADKWTLGQGLAFQYTSSVQTMGFFRARLTLATIYAKTDRIGEAREIWESLRPTHAADVDGWTLLAGVAQLHEQQDLAFEYYRQALQAAKALAADPLLQRIFGGSLGQMWYGGESAVDTSFNKIVEAFAGRERLLELYDFLRDTDQVAKARLVARQYELNDKLEQLYRERLAAAAETFQRSADDPLEKSVAYFAAACKSAELLDQNGHWDQAQRIYRSYLDDFPDELQLLVTLSEAAEAQGDFAAATEWEKKVLGAKERLSRRVRDWAMRSVYLTPAMPQVLQNRIDTYRWQQRWGKSGYWGWGSGAGNALERWPSWMRIAQLYLAVDNRVAAAHALERAIGVSGTHRKNVARQVLTLIRTRRLLTDMLGVLRSLAVHHPTDEAIQLAFAESLEANQRGPIAAEVYRRMLRRGVSDIGVLARVRRALEAVDPEAAAGAITTLEALEAEVGADAENAGDRLRLAKAYFYSLRLDDALSQLIPLQKTAPHLEGLHDLLVEIHTIRNDSEALLEALRAKIERSADEKAKRQTRLRLADELLSLGRTEEALDALKKLTDAQDPSSYQRVGMLLHYFGRHEEALAQFELAARSTAHRAWGGRGVTLAHSLVLKGDPEGAVDKILESVDEAARAMTQYGGMAAMYSMFQNQENPFDRFVSLLVIEPKLLSGLEQRLVRRREDSPSDPQAARLLMSFYRRIGRSAQADAILERMTIDATDQTLVMQRIDRAVERRRFEEAVELAEAFIADQPKPVIPPGMPAQFAGMMTLMSPRNVMLCKLGDVYWKMDRKEEAFDRYKQIVDEQVDETRMAYASICLLRERREEAAKLLGEALEKQQLPSPGMLQFQALLMLLDDRPKQAFEQLVKAAEAGEGQAANPFSYGGGGDADVNALAQLARYTDQLDAFTAFMDKRIKRNPNKWEDHRILAQTLFDAGRTDEAADVLERAGQVKTLRREALQQRIGWLEAFAPAESLIPLYDELIELSEKEVAVVSQARWSPYAAQRGAANSQPLRERLAALLWQSGEHDLAVEKRIGRVDLKQPDVLVNLAKWLAEVNDEERAAEFLEKAIDVAPQHAGAHRALARLAHYRADSGGVVRHLREVFRQTQSGAGDQNRYQPYTQYGPYGGYRGSYRQGNARDELSLWAADALLAAPGREADDDAIDGLMLAVLTGDWATVESELDARLGASPYDPLTWTLRAKLLERQREHAGAAEAWEYVRRLGRTTLPRHRELLKIVLAGKQVKDAAGGTRDARASATPGNMPANMPAGVQFTRSTYYSPYGGGNAETKRLASLYIEIGDFERAERLYLLMNSGNMAYALPSLASLMWQQDRRQRAVELLRLSVIMSEQQNMTGQYAASLAETGEVDKAIELLVRAYRCAEPQAQGFSPWTYYGNSQNQEFEDYQESNYSHTLFSVLTRSGRIDAVIDDLQRRADADPPDPRLGKLVLSLLIQAGRWEQARSALERWAEDRPHDTAVRSELMNAHMQTQEWAKAEAVLETLQRDLPQFMDRWRMVRGFLRLMQDDSAGSLAAIEPLLSGAGVQDAMGVVPQNVWALLAAMGEFDRLREHLQEHREKNPLDSVATPLLFNIYRKQQRWGDAARIALEELWANPEVVNESSGWLRALKSVAAADPTLRKTVERPADRALLTLLVEGPQAGRAAFQQALSDAPGSIEAQRGLLLAALMLKDDVGAAEANAALIERLAPIRRRTIRPSSTNPVARAAKRQIAGMQISGDTTMVLGMAASFGNIVQQILQQMSGASQQPPAQYDALWTAQQHLAAELLVRTRRLDDLPALLRTQSAVAKAREHVRQNRSYNSMGYYPGSFSYTSYQGGRWNNNGDAGDWKSIHRRLLREGLAFGELCEQITKLGARLPAHERSAAADALAALGRTDEAQRFRRRVIDAVWVALRAGDAPQIGSDASYGWGWRRFSGAGAEETQRLRSALQQVSSHVSRNGDDEQPDPAFPGFRPPADELWELALVDDVAERRLLELAEKIGPGWDQTHTLSQTMAFWRARREPGRLLELLDKVFDTDRLLGSQHVSAYLSACLDAGDAERLERVLDAIAERDSSLEDQVSICRLIALRRQGLDSDADELERQLLDRCKVEPPNPHRIDPDLLSQIANNYSPTFQIQYQYYNQFSPWAFGGRNNNRQQHGWGLHSALATVAELARAAGLRFRDGREDHDLSLTHIQNAYASNGLPAHAARLTDLRLERDAAILTRRARAELLERTADWLMKADDAGAARKAAEQAATYWLAEHERLPTNPLPPHQLWRLYKSDAFGKDFAKAYEPLQAAKRLDPALDPDHLADAKCHFELGRYAEAWAIYRTALERGKIGEDSETLYTMVIAAARAGQRDAVLSIGRLALWRDPAHKLAAQVREIMQDD